MDFHTVLKRWRGGHNAASAAVKPATPAAAEGAAVAELLRLGASQRQLAQHQEATRTLMHAIELRHDCGEAHHELGLVHFDLGRFEDAADCFQLAVHYSPQLAVAHRDLGVAFTRLGRGAEAESACRRALELEPQSAAAWFHAGNACKLRGELEQAVECYGAALARDPGLVDAACQLAFVLYKLGRYAESRASHAAALAVRPDFAEVHHNLGLLLLETGHAEEALGSFERALALRPDTPETRVCIAHALRDLGRLDEALAQYDRVLAHQPQFGDAVINRCYALLMRGDYAGGWVEYERRFAATATPERGFPFPGWHGEPLGGKRILVYAEQGLGDEIMFASCLPDVVQRAGHAVIECSIRLAQLFARSFPLATVHGASKDDNKAWLRALPPTDFQVAIGSLPLSFRRLHTEFPAHRGYLRADDVRVEFWRSQFAATGGKLRVGIAWRGGSLRSRQFTRSVALPCWLPLLAQSGVDFVSLQYGDVANELAQLRLEHGIAVRSFGEALADIDELAAAITALDLVISVDTTVVHLAGALGRPVWVLLSNAPEWRYPRSGATMPWYPSARLFHQMTSGEWAPVISQVCDAMRQLAHERGV